MTTTDPYTPREDDICEYATIDQFHGDLAEYERFNEAISRQNDDFRAWTSLRDSVVRLELDKDAACGHWTAVAVTNAGERFTVTETQSLRGGLWAAEELVGEVCEAHIGDPPPEPGDQGAEMILNDEGADA